MAQAEDGDNAMASLQDQDSMKLMKDDIPENLNKSVEEHPPSAFSGMVLLEESNKENNPENTNKPLEKDSPMASVQDNNIEVIPNNIPVENDSGMASLQDSSKDVTPEKPNKPLVGEESDDEDIEDETLGERLWGLTEMFPESLVNGTCTVLSGTKSGIKGLYSLSRSILWIFFSSSVILVAPMLVEVERTQLLESQRSQEKQMLLGSSAMSSPSNLGPNIAMMPTR